MKLNLTNILEKGAKKKLVSIVICEGWDERCLRASSDILKRKLAKIILLGNPKDIAQKAKQFKVDISKAVIVDFKKSELQEELAEKLVELRKHKGMTLAKAQELLQDENYFGCMYVASGYADAVAGSAICPTADLMRPALQILRKKDAIVSEVVIVNDVKNDRHLIISDGSLNIAPTSEELSQIAVNAIGTAVELGIKPKVAFLSYSTKGSGGDGEDIQQIRKAVELTRKAAPQAMVDGEMQFDAAVNPQVAKRKCPDSPLQGEANIVIFPNLMAANIFFHGMLQFSSMNFEFTVMKGMQKPVAILGRSMPQDAVTRMIIGCAMEVNAQK